MCGFRGWKGHKPPPGVCSTNPACTPPWPVLLGFAVPVIRRAEGPGPGLAEHIEHCIRSISAGVAVPVFAFFAAGVSITDAGGLGETLGDTSPARRQHRQAGAANGAPPPGMRHPPGPLSRVRSPHRQAVRTVAELTETVKSVGECREAWSAATADCKKGAPMTTLPSPGPQDPEPLSVREKKILAQIEGGLESSDPSLANLSTTVGRRQRPPVWRTDRVLQAMAVLVIVVTILPGPWLFVLIIIGILAGPPLTLILTARRDPEKDPRDPPPDG